MHATSLKSAYHDVVGALDLARQVSAGMEGSSVGAGASSFAPLVRKLRDSVSDASAAVSQLSPVHEYSKQPFASGRASLDAARTAVARLTDETAPVQTRAIHAKHAADHLDDAARSLRAVNVAESPRPVALELHDRWVWDSWYVDDGEKYHMFFLHAPKSLKDPELRHTNARIGHAVSDDLKKWTEVAPALEPSASPAWDDLAVWTGSTVRLPDDSWRMYYTAVSRAEDGHVQRIGMADSDDLINWTKHPKPILEADGKHYEKLGDSAWEDEAWRDPSVTRDPSGDGYHMLITARAKQGDLLQRGVVGHATSPDMTNWTAREPLSKPGQGFGEHEVLTRVRPKTGDEASFSTYLYKQDRGAGTPASSGFHTAPFDAQRGEFITSRSQRIAPPDLYAGQIFEDRNGKKWVFAYEDEHGADIKFRGKVVGPIPYEP